MSRGSPTQTSAIPAGHGATARLGVAELLVDHAIEIEEHLDDLSVGIAVIDRDVVARAMPDPTPRDFDPLAPQQVAGAMHSEDLNFEHDMVDRPRSPAAS